MSNKINNFKWPTIIPTDYIDESLGKILDRDQASRIGFRYSDSFPTVSDEDIGLVVYRIDLKAAFRLTEYDSEAIWTQISNETGTPITLEMMKLQFQPLNTILTSLSNTLGTKDSIPFFGGTNNLQLTPSTINGRNFLNLNTIVAMREFLGLGTISTLSLPLAGSNIQDKSIGLEKLMTSATGAIGFETGDVKLTLQINPKQGWLRMDDGSIGNSLSNASNKQGEIRNGSAIEVQNLFNLLWQIPSFPIQTATGASTTRTESALIDWNANKKILLPKVLGRAIAASGQGGGLSSRDLGSSIGEEKHELTIEEMPKHHHPGVNPNGPVTTGLKSGVQRHDIAQFSSGSSAGDVGGSQAHNIMQPTVFLNCFIKL